MDLGLRGKTALVTAGSRGIGRACALALAAEGVRVAVCARTAADVANVLEELGGEAAGHRGFVCDLLESDAPVRLARQVVEQFQALDIVVHNLGGTLSVRGIDVPIADWRRVFRANFEVAVEINGVVLPAMLERKSGRIIAISSLAGDEHQGALPYAAAKAALNAYIRGLGRELAKSGVVVSAVSPGTVLTENGVWDIRRRTDPESVEKYIAEKLPAGAFQRPERIADIVAFLASERATEFTGSVLAADGGQGRSFVAP
ncbi:MAG: SDR family NAD(P)-dependent oxidoreductase [Candidatus Velthaea sp.]